MTDLSALDAPRTDSSSNNVVQFSTFAAGAKLAKKEAGRSGDGAIARYRAEKDPCEKGLIVYVTLKSRGSLRRRHIAEDPVVLSERTHGGFTTMVLCV
jgi:hypothetical protein